MTDEQQKKHGRSILRIPILKMGTFSAIDWFVAISVTLTLIWKPLSIWILGFDAAGRVPFLMLAISLILYAKRILRTSFRFPLALYCLVAVYMFVNGYLQQGYRTYPSDGIYLMFCAALQAPAVMLLIAAGAKKDFDATVDYLILALYTYVLLALFCSGLTHVNRLELEINANEIALYTAILCILMLLKFFRRRLSFLALVLLLVIPFFVIIETGSRMALAMVAFVLIAAIFIVQNIRNVKSLAVSLLLIGTLVLGMSYIMSNTLMGERIRGTTTQTEKNKSVGTSTMLDKFGDRGLQYFYSWPYFLQNPVFGIGFNNWIVYNPLKLVCHSEYMVQYVENGLVAFIPYMIFFIGLMRRTLTGRKHKDPKWRQSASILFAALLAIAFSNSVLWSHDQFCVFAVYALSFAVETPGKKTRRRIRLVFGSPKKHKEQ